MLPAFGVTPAPAAPVTPGQETGELLNTREEQEETSVTRTFNRNAVPNSVRHLGSWFVVGQVLDERGQSTKMRYSPTTLGELRLHEPGDFSDMDVAVDAAEDHAWLDGVWLRLPRPYFVLAIPECYDFFDRLAKWVRPFAARLGGYWERPSGTKNVIGILRSDAEFEGGLAEYRETLQFPIREGLFPITGQPLHGLRHDPDSTNQQALATVLAGMRRDIDLLRRMSQCSYSFRQLYLF